MPWADPLPSQEELDYWAFSGEPGFNRISHWPKPNSARVNCFFRLKYTLPELVPIAGRYGFYYTEQFEDWDPGVPALNQFGRFDFEGIAEGHVRLVTPANSEGFTVQIDIEDIELLPIIQEPGVQCTVTTTHATFGTQVARGEWSAKPLRNNWFHNMQTDLQEPESNWQYQNDPTWTIPILVPHIVAVADCFSFPRLAVGFAAFNGVDSYVSLDHNIDGFAQAFTMDADIRLHDVTTFWPILGREASGGFFGMDGADLIFGNLRLPTTWVPVLDTWFHWRYEFEQDVQLEHALFINQVEVMRQATNRQFSQFNNLGVYRHSLPAPIWGNFDMHDLKIMDGDSGGQTVKLDLPLILNALDLGPEANHGTTFNMPLPSV